MESKNAGINVNESELTKTHKNLKTNKEVYDATEHALEYDETLAKQLGKLSGAEKPVC